MIARHTQRQTIVTKYIGPRDVKGSRVKATAQAGSVTLTYDPSMNSEENHAAACQALADKFKWSDSFVGGRLPDDSCAWVSLADGN